MSQALGPVSPVRAGPALALLFRILTAPGRVRRSIEMTRSKSTGGLVTLGEVANRKIHRSDKLRIRHARAYMHRKATRFTFRQTIREYLYLSPRTQHQDICG